MPEWGNCRAGEKPGGATTRGQRPRKGHWGTHEGPWGCELIAGASWIEDFASNRILHASYEQLGG